MTTPITFELPGPPQPKQRARRGRDGRWYTPEATAAYEAAVGWAARAAGIDRAYMGPVRLTVQLWFPDRRRRDIDNAAKAIMDALSGIAWGDGLPGSGTDRHAPRGAPQAPCRDNCGELAVKTSTGLTEKQRLFVEEYPKDLNATNAAIRAGYSAKTAKSQGCRLLTNVDIRAEIKQRSTGHLAEVSEEAREAVLSRHQVLLEDSAIATSNLWDLVERVTSRGIIWKDINDMPVEIQRLVQEVAVDPEKGNVKVKMHSKHPSLQRLAKYHGLLEGVEPEEAEEPPKEVDAEWSENGFPPEEARLKFADYLMTLAEMYECMDIPVRELVDRLRRKELE